MPKFDWEVDQHPECDTLSVLIIVVAHPFATEVSDYELRKREHGEEVRVNGPTSVVDFIYEYLEKSWVNKCKKHDAPHSPDDWEAVARFVTLKAFRSHN